jgi:DNA repair exonuclease SbcCD ATPase subunit
MLSILQKQAKLLEKELKDKQKEVLTLNQEARELRSVVDTRELRIEVLEAELRALREAAPADTLPSGDPNPARPPESMLGSSEFDALKTLVADLVEKLGSCEGKLSFAELRASMMSLQKATQEVSHMGALRKLESSLEAAKAEIQSLRASQRNHEGLSLELAQVQDDVRRRNEQLEFLMHVHEASAGYDWVNSNGATTSSSGPGSPLSSSSALDSRIEMLQMIQDSQLDNGSAQSLTGGLEEWRRSQRQLCGDGGRQSPVSVQSVSSPSAAPFSSSSSQQGYAAGSAGSAAAHLGSGGVQDPVSALEELGVDAQTAIAALERFGGDLDQAVLSLFPAS